MKQRCHLGKTTLIFLVMFSLLACQSQTTPIVSPQPTTADIFPSSTPSTLLSSLYLRPVVHISGSSSIAVTSAVLSPDGTRLLFTIADQSNNTVYTVLWDMLTTPPSQITTFPTLENTTSFTWLADSSSGYLFNSEGPTQIVTRQGITQLFPATPTYEDNNLLSSPDSRYFASNGYQTLNPIILTPIVEGIPQVSRTIAGPTGLFIGWLDHETLIFVNPQGHVIADNLLQQTKQDLGVIAADYLPLGRGDISPDKTALVNFVIRASPVSYSIVSSTGIHLVPSPYAIAGWVENNMLLAYTYNALNALIITTINSTTGVFSAIPPQATPQSNVYPAAGHWILCLSASNMLSIENIDSGQSHSIATLSNSYFITNIAQNGTQYLIYDGEIYEIILTPA